jgi:SOS response associated peptidase (SRAP)
VAFNTIDAEAEVVATSPAFLEPWMRRLCLVSADCFCKWKKVDEKIKQPHAIAMKDGGLFAFAGLRDTLKDKASGHELQTYTISTTDPNELLNPIHNRMPVIVARKDYERWMPPTALSAAKRVAEIECARPSGTALRRRPQGIRTSVLPNIGRSLQWAREQPADFITRKHRVQTLRTQLALRRHFCAAAAKEFDPLSANTGFKSELTKERVDSSSGDDSRL